MRRKLSMNRIITVGMLLCLLLPAGLSAKGLETTRVVEVIGTAGIGSKGAAAAREQAIADSLVAAVEMVAGGIVPLDAVIKNFQTLDQVLYRQTEAFVQDYKVLTELASEGQYRVLVQATIGGDKIRQALERVGVIVSLRSFPSVLVLVAEQNVGDPVPAYPWASATGQARQNAASVLSEMLRQEQVKPIDAGVLQAYRKQIPGAGAQVVDDGTAVRLGRKANADMVVLGEVRVRPSANTMGAAGRSFRSVLKARVLNARTGAEIARTSRAAVSAGDDASAAGSDALLKAGTLGGRDLAVQIMDFWKRERAAAAGMTVVVGGTGDLAAFVAFRRAVSDIQGVNAILVREIRPDEATLGVNFDGDSQMLAEAMMLENYAGFGINIYEVTDGRIMLELVPE